MLLLVSGVCGSFGVVGVMFRLLVCVGDLSGLVLVRLFSCCCGCGLCVCFVLLFGLVF